jgi:hypothetical protein
MAFPTTPIIDDFDRSDENPLGAPWDNPLAFAGVDALELSGNQLRCTTDDIAGGRIALPGSSADQEAYVTLAALPATGAGSFVVSVRTQIGVGTDIDGYDVAVSVAAGAWSIRRVDNLAATVLNSGTLVEGAVSAGDSFGISVIGTTITLHFKPAAGSWRDVDSATDSTYSARGDALLSVDISGTSVGDPDWRLDDFGGGDHVPDAPSWGPLLALRNNRLVRAG